MSLPETPTIDDCLSHAARLLAEAESLLIERKFEEARSLVELAAEWRAIAEAMVTSRE